MDAMPIVLVTGPANSGKAGVVLDALRAHHARGEEPLLVVPTRADVEHYRRELAGAGLVLGARVERFEGLLSEVVRRAGRSPVGRAGGSALGRPLSRLARERVLAAVAARTQPTSSPAAGAPASGTLRHTTAGPTSPDGPDRDHPARDHPARDRPTPGLVRALAAFVGELEIARVTPGRLREATRAWAAADPTHTDRALDIAELFEGYHSALEELRRVDPERRAARALDALRRAPALWGATPVLLYGFDDLSRLQLDAIETLGAVVGAPVTVSLAYEPGRTAFAGRAGTFQTLLPLATEHRALAPRTEHYAPSARPALHHLERCLFEPERPSPAPAGETVRLLEGGNERAELELVVGEIRLLLDRGLEPGEIAVAHRSPGSIAELLAEVFRAHGVPYSLERRLPFAHTAVGRGLLGLLAAALGRDDGRLEDLLAWLRAPGMLKRPELADRLEARARRAGATTATQARALWEAEHWPLEALDRLRVAADRGPMALIERTAGELERLFCAPRLRRADVLGPVELLEARALATGQAALEGLHELARRAPKLAPDGHELIAILRDLELVVDDESPGALTEPQVNPSDRPPETVAVLHPLALRARRVRALFLCGLQEGVFPAPARPEPLLSEDERRGLAEASGLRLGLGGDRESTLAAERYLLYAAVSRPEELLVLSWHTADDDGLASARSLFVDDICDLFADDLHAGGELSPASSTVGVSPGIAPLREEAVLARLREERLWSASALETWAGCPVRWFVERLLRARDLDPDPEPLARGGLAHAALRDVLEGLRCETGSARLTPERLPKARELLHAALRERAQEFPLSVAPERVPGVRRRLEADLERYLEHAAGAALEGDGQASSLEPVHLELPFGFPEEQDALPALDLGEGVLVRGRIDRVDVGSRGEAVVYDYKSSYAPEPNKWVGERSFQIPLYMRALQALPDVRDVVGGFYQPLSGRDLRARGVLACEEGLELQCVRGDARERADLQALVGEVAAAAREAAAQARAGALEARPQTCGFAGSGCAYPTICRCER
jgi:ATP-dependent helicase/DNAse subunit B